MAAASRSAKKTRATKGLPRQAVLHLCDDAIERAAMARWLSDMEPGLDTHSLGAFAEATEALRGGLSAALVLYACRVLRPFELEALAGLKAKIGEAPIVVYGVATAGAARNLFGAGADAVVGAGCEPAQLIEILRLVLRGVRYMSPELVEATEQPDACALFGACGVAMPLLRDLPIGLALLQGERVLYANRYLEQQFGFDVQRFRGLPFWAAVADPHRAEVKRALLAGQTGDTVPPHFVAPVRVGDGSIRWFESFHAKATVAGAPAIVVVGVDATERMSGMTVEQARHLSVVDLARHGAPDLPAGAPDRPKAAAESRRIEQLPLTRRQRQVLDLLATGASNREIAATLGVAEATVKLHMHRLMRVLGVSNRTEAALAARRG